jgi:cytoskeleton protein RodZ
MAVDRGTSGFGRKLRDARERRGISLRQIANATKISIRALEALERNDISQLPGGIFSRAFVRSYAIEVGLDPVEIIQQFVQEFPTESITAGHSTTAQVEDNEIHESNRRMAAALVRVIALSVPIAAAILYFSLVRPRNSQPPVERATRGGDAGDRAIPGPAGEPVPAAATMPAGKTAETPLADPAARDLQARTSPAASAGFVRIGLSASGPCWVVAIADGQRSVARELQAGETAVLEIRRELDLTAGNAAALKVTLNGANARPLGKPGQVVRLRLTPANFTEYLAVP